MTYIRVNKASLGYRGLGRIGADIGGALSAMGANASAGATFAAMDARAADGSVSAQEGLNQMLQYGAAASRIDDAQAAVTSTTTAAMSGGQVTYIPELDKKIPVRTGGTGSPPDITMAEAQKLVSMMQGGKVQLSPIANAVLNYFRSYNGLDVNLQKKSGGGSIMAKIGSIFGGDKPKAVVNAAADAYSGFTGGASAAQRAAAARQQAALQAEGQVDVGNVALWVGGVAIVGGILYAVSRKK